MAGFGVTLRVCGTRLPPYQHLPTSSFSEYSTDLSTMVFEAQLEMSQ